MRREPLRMKGSAKGTVQYGPQRTDKYTKFVHEGLMENPCKLRCNLTFTSQYEYNHRRQVVFPRIYLRGF